VLTPEFLREAGISVINPGARKRARAAAEKWAPWVAEYHRLRREGFGINKAREIVHAQALEKGVRLGNTQMKQWLRDEPQSK
jgi:hypothetical protein